MQTKDLIPITSFKQFEAGKQYLCYVRDTDYFFIDEWIEYRDQPVSWASQTMLVGYGFAEDETMELYTKGNIDVFALPELSIKTICGS